MCAYVCVCIYIYIYIHVHTYALAFGTTIHSVKPYYEEVTRPNQHVKGHALPWAPIVHQCIREFTKGGCSKGGFSNGCVSLVQL